MWKKLLRKKNIALFLGLMPVLLIGVLYLLLFTFARGTTSQIIDEWVGFAGALVLFFSPYFFTLLVSIPAYFMREEVHSLWFTWMMCIYMPIACLRMFFIAQNDSGFMPGAGVVVFLIQASVGFLILSIILIATKYYFLRRKSK